MPNMLQRLVGTVRAAARSASMTWTGYGSGQTGQYRVLLPSTEYDYEAAAGDLWRSSPVASCLRWGRTNFSEPRLQAAREDSDGDVEVIPGHPAVTLWERPNPAYDRYVMGAAVFLSSVVDGNAYLRKIRSRAGRPVELWWIPHWLINPCWPGDGSQFISHYEYQVNGRIETIPREDIIHFRQGIDPHNERRGLSELKQAVRAIVGLNECDTFTSAILRNMGIPGVVLSPGLADVSFDEDDIRIIKDGWRERYTGDNRGDPMIGSRALKVEKLSMTPEELALDKIPARMEDQICAAIGINPMVVGMTSGAQHKTFANYSEARKAAYEDCLIPLQKAFAECLKHQLLEPDFGDATVVRFDYTGINCLAENETEVATRVGGLYQTARVIKRSEAREALGYDFDEEDEVYADDVAASLMTPIGATDEEDPREEPAEGGDLPDGADDDDEEDEPSEGEKRGPFRRDKSPGTPAGDEDDPHEDNTFGLPNGNPIRRKIKRFAQIQLKAILGTIPDIGAPIPTAFPPLTDYDDPMASAMTPMISAYWDESGRLTRERLGLDPDDWQVTDPHLHEQIKQATLNFCQSTNATTSMKLDEALAALRRELMYGLVEQGESIPELTKRVKSVFAGLRDSHAEMIARTEAARAVHAASLISAKESGVVAGKKWLLSTNACELCHKMADAVPPGGVPIEASFGTVGSNPVYSNVRMPPAHPHCRCTVVYTLTPEYERILGDEGPPLATFDPGPMGPEPKPRKIAKKLQEAST